MSASVLHVFARACNLIGDSGQIVSLLSNEIGPGPFAILLPISVPLTQLISRDDHVAVRGTKITLGSLTVETSGATVWRATPPWHETQRKRRAIRDFLPTIVRVLDEHARVPQGALAARAVERSSAAASLLLRGLRENDTTFCISGAEMLAGLGYGLTPSGDDYLMGVLYAIWATHSHREAHRLASAICTSAVPRTTSFSAAWLAAAARGEAAQSWHDLLEGIGGDQELAASSLRRILAFGHSSGAAALAGFTAAFHHLEEGTATC